MSATLQSSYSRTGDGRELVDSLLEMPSGRQILMTESISRLALANLNEEGMTWTLISGYRDVPDLSGEELISTATDTINDARAASGVSPLTDGDRYQAAAVLLADSVIRGERTPSEAAERIMTAMSRNNQSRVQAWVMLTDDLERLGLPDEIVITPNLPAAVMVAPWQGADEPWSMYRVIIITPQIRRGSPTQLVWDALRPGQKIGLMNRPASRVVPMGASWSLN